MQNTSQDRGIAKKEIPIFTNGSIKSSSIKINLVINNPTNPLNHGATKLNGNIKFQNNSERSPKIVITNKNKILALKNSNISENVGLST